jgi:hypothetical protein
MLDWFDKAREFKRNLSEQLSQTGFAVLEESEPPEESSLPANVEVEAVEIPGVYRVQDSYRGCSGLRFFMDGVQRTVLWQYYNYEGVQVPLFLHFSGACVIERVRRDQYVPLYSAYNSEILVPKFIFKETGIQEGVVDTGAEKPWDLNEIKSRAKVKSRALRQELELKVVNRFLDSHASEETLLVKDGNLIGTPRSKPVIGLVKTHNTLYLQEKYPQVQRMVWNMEEYHRSNVFAIRQREKQGWSHRSNSFYLRLHPPTQPETGLLRVEYEDLPLPVDELASWLIAERYVIAKGPRWDRQIYPIQVCEDYLRTQLPNMRTIETALKSFEVAL